MTSASVRIEGLEALYRRFDSIDDLADALVVATREALKLLDKRLREYPPPPANSRYIRTYRLRESWRKRIDRTPYGAVGTVESVGVSYNRYVMDDVYQAEIHRGRWHTVQSVAAEKSEEINDIYGRYVKARLEK